VGLDDYFSMRRRIIWMLFMAGGYWLMFGIKGGYDNNAECLTVAVAGAVIGLGFAYASEKPDNITAARLKIAYWPVTLVLFVTYPTIGIWLDNRDWGTGWIWKPFSVAASIGLLVGIAHCLAACRKLRLHRNRRVRE